MRIKTSDSTWKNSEMNEEKCAMCEMKNWSTGKLLELEKKFEEGEVFKESEVQICESCYEEVLAFETAKKVVRQRRNLFKYEN